jgi:hypothetical protein
MDRCVADLRRVLASSDAFSNLEILTLAAIAVKAAEGIGNPFEVVI